jgi:uncharacterized damage-inducible protein DinB
VSVFKNPYAADLGDRVPLDALADAADAIRRTCAAFDAARWAASYGPGKWSAAEILVHLAQIEMVFGVRARFALGTGSYVAQAFEQDPVMAIESPLVDGPTALQAFLGLRALNVRFFRGLTASQLAETFQHPEQGTMAVSDLMAYLAGHDWRHVGQLRQIANGND